ncbi:hypothetical protein R5W24_000611 [Gemmata sp. JC717]|nr:hypothetical protein [Gemmata algarum]MDY3551533.1 hypothetical protein [Gemmata algarum]
MPASAVLEVVAALAAIVTVWFALLGWKLLPGASAPGSRARP